MLHVVLLHQSGQLLDGLLLLALSIGGVDHRRIQHLARAVYHSDFTAHAVARVQTHGHLALDWGLHEQGLEVQGKHVDGTLVGLVGEVAADLTLQRGLDEAVVGVIGGGADKGHGGRARDQHRPAHGHMGGLRIQLHRDLQNVLPLAPVDGQHLIALDAADRAFEIVVEAVHRVLRLLIRRLGHHHTPAQEQRAQLLADGGVIRNFLRDDIAGTLEGGLNAVYPLLRIDEVGSRLLGSGTVPLLGEEQLGQGS